MKETEGVWKGYPEDESCQNCPVNDANGYAKEELCDDCFKKKLARMDLWRKEWELTQNLK